MKGWLLTEVRKSSRERSDGSKLYLNEEFVLALFNDREEANKRVNQLNVDNKLPRFRTVYPYSNGTVENEHFNSLLWDSLPEGSVITRNVFYGSPDAKDLNKDESFSLQGNP